MNLRRSLPSAMRRWRNSSRWWSWCCGLSVAILILVVATAMILGEYAAFGPSLSNTATVTVTALETQHHSSAISDEWMYLDGRDWRLRVSSSTQESAAKYDVRARTEGRRVEIAETLMSCKKRCQCYSEMGNESDGVRRRDTCCYGVIFTSSRDSLQRIRAERRFPIHTATEYDSARLGTCERLMFTVVSHAPLLPNIDSDEEEGFASKRAKKQHDGHASITALSVQAVVRIRQRLTAMELPFTGGDIRICDQQHPTYSCGGPVHDNNNNNNNNKKTTRTRTNTNIHFMMLSSPRFLESRVEPALRTWLAPAANEGGDYDATHHHQHQHQVTVFWDWEGSGAEAHQERQGDDRFLLLSGDQLIERVARVAEAHRVKASSVLLLRNPNRESGGSTTSTTRHAKKTMQQRISLHGAWKPLFVLLIAAAHINDDKNNVYEKPSWFVLCDDDTYFIRRNLVWHLNVLLTTDQPQQLPVVMGSEHEFRKQVRPFTTKVIKTGASSDRIDQEVRAQQQQHRLRYFQGGAGIVFSATALTVFDACLRRTLGVAEVRRGRREGRKAFGLPNVTFGPREVVYYDRTDAVRDCNGNETTTSPDYDPREVIAVNLVKDFADDWPAGDMRVAWAMHLCNDRHLGSSGSGSVPKVRPSSALTFRDNHAFAHRSLELSLGKDHRHWNRRSNHPASFHRLRDASDFDRVHWIVARGEARVNVAQDKLNGGGGEGERCAAPLPMGWYYLETESAGWWYAAAHSAAAADRGGEGGDIVRDDLFFDDEGMI